MWCNNMKNNAIRNNTITQYLEISAVWLRYLSGPVLLQITVKYFNFQITVSEYKSIQLNTFA